MSIALIHTGRTPAQGQFDLDRFIEHYKADAAADSVLIDISVPQKGDAHPDYPFMFLTDRQVQETSEKASSVDLIYTGALKISGGNPVLPPAQNTDDASVLSASSKRASNGVVLTNPITASFYGPSIERSWITYNTKGNISSVPDPTAAIKVITLAIGDDTLAGTSLDVDLLVSMLFQPYITYSLRSTELVAGKYWLNVGKKIKSLVPWLVNVSSGYYPGLYAAGFGYEIGDTIHISSGGTCDMTVTNVYSGGQILGLSIGANSLSVAVGPPGIAATGGHGSGARFIVVHV